MIVKRLPSGYWLIQGEGACNWCQPEHWPCDEAHIREHSFAQASETFIRACVYLAIELTGEGE